MGLINRAWRLMKRPTDHDFSDALELHTRDIPRLREGQVLVHNGYLSLDAGTRMWMTARVDSYDAPMQLGAIMRGQTLGKVVESRHPDYQPGQLLRFRGDWADFSLLQPDDDTYVEHVTWQLNDLKQHLAALGPNGWTAFVGVHEIGEAKPGETFVVSAASGVTGALAGQIAKLSGCRVVGITSSPNKAHWLNTKLGFDVAIDSSSHADIGNALKSACPQGIDVYFENVGGTMLDAALDNMARYGRVAVCGLLVNYDKASAPAGPARFDQILMKRLKMTGFFSADWHWRGAEINRKLRPWYDAGRLQMQFDVTEGLESAPQGYQRLFTGDKLGKALVRISDL